MMKSIRWFVVIGAFLLCSCMNARVAQEGPEGFEYIIDVRSDQEFAAGHLEHAIHIPYGQIEAEIAKHVSDKEAHVMLYCAVGGRSGIAQRRMKKMGYVNAVNGGGFKALKKKGF